MNYKQIREIDLNNKKSCEYIGTKVDEYGDFSVCTTRTGDIFIVDTDIAKKISNRSWCKGTHGYMLSRINDNLVFLHDYVMAQDNEEKPQNYYVDHINRDKMDNRRLNLRFVTPLENSMNRSLKSDNKSGVTGVCKAKDRYRAYITINKRKLNLGYYKTLEEASAARIEAETRFGFKARPKNIAELCALEGDHDGRLSHS